MAKKTSVARRSSAARKPQATDKPAQVRLVRPEGSAAGVAPGALLTASTAGAATGSQPAIHTPPSQRAAAPADPRTSAARSVARPALMPAPRPVVPPAPMPAPRPGTPAALGTARAPDRTQANRIARARATQRARTAYQITPEHYSYVLRDLRLTAALAALMFSVIIILHFVLA